MSEKLAAPKEPQSEKNKNSRETSDATESLSDFRIVAIGASAGGLEALKEFFNHVPNDCPHSFVIIQHLSPDYQSLMAELLSKNTLLPIYEIKNNMEVRKGSVYLIPPKKNLTIINNRLMLVNKPKGHDLNLPIDIFFKSLAQEYKEQSIGIILSGTGSDGTSGALTIKEKGGMVMVQDPNQAKFGGMPQSAVNTGLVDYALPVEQLPAELIDFIDHPKVAGASEHQIERDKETTDRILHQIRNITNIDFYHYKRPTLIRRIARRIGINKFNSPKEYLDFLFENPKEVHILAREFLIGVTKFFRDSKVWEVMETRVVPEMVRGKSPQDIIKVWCVGSSTGEEAYSMAILILEEMEKQGKKLEVKIFATDIENDHLEIGSRGIYPESIIADVSKSRLNKYFIKNGDEYQVVDTLRRMIIFSQHNVLKDPPFNKMDITICRNLLIYMQPVAQRKILGLLHYSLNMNGVLLLGSSETLGDFKNVMNEVDRSSKLYRNIKPARTLGMEPLNYPDIQKLSPGVQLVKLANKVDIRMAEVMNETVADEMGIAGVYIDENCNILHAVGEFKKFIRLPDKGFSINLLKMLPNTTSIMVGTTVRKVLKSDERIRCKNMKLRRNRKTIILDLLVSPFKINHATNAKGCLLIFFPKGEQKGSAKVIDSSKGVVSKRIAELEEELSEARESLLKMVQEVDTGNEELQATNEELLAANEELQSTNEELQSVNEELHTVNAELQQKIEDLASLNADMDNLLQSTGIGTIFLDREMRIRNFTPAVREYFNFRDSDIDRPINHFASNFGSDEDIYLMAQQVLNSGNTTQKELRSNKGDWFLKRVTPYRDQNDIVDGVVLTFVDINELKKAQEIVIKSEQEFKALYDNAPDMLATVDRTGLIIKCNSKLYKEFGCENASDMIGMPISDLYGMKNKSTTKKRLEKFKETGKMENVERHLQRKDGSLLLVSVNAQTITDENGNIIYTLYSMRDVSDLAAAKKLYVDQSLAFEEVLEGTKTGYWDWHIQEKREYYSSTFKNMLGYKDDELEDVPSTWQNLIHPDDLSVALETFDKHVNSKGEFPYDLQVRYFHFDGSTVWILCRGKVVEWSNTGAPLRMVGSHVDITPLKKIEEELHRSNGELEQFAYVASHDLQEPLNTITDFVGLLEKEYKNKLDGDADQYIDFITEAANRMSGLVKSVLSYSRIGRSDEMTVFDCHKVVEQVVKDLQKRITDTKATILIEKLPKLRGNEIEIHSLFMNLISNGIKFRQEKHDPKITISSEEQDQHWKFSVSDNGIGIAEKNLDRVFNIFQRLNNLDKFEGTGIGLAQCKKIVELHSGQIWIESSLGKGSTVHFTIKK